jgi:proline iminopeptidase
MHAMPSAAPDALFPAIEPYAHGFLPEQDGHTVYFEQCGNPAGLPMLFVHGGPGSGAMPRHRQFFDPRSTRVILWDQRGCGRSRAARPLLHNTTAHLIADMERIRTALGLEAWWVVGGSWGAGLALAYASAHPQRCLGLVLRGTFLGRAADIRWFFQDAAQLLPDAWWALARHVPSAQRGDMAGYVVQQVLQGDAAHALELAKAWSAWEGALTDRRASLVPSSSGATADAALLAKYRLQSHYLAAQCFFPPEGALAGCTVLGKLPVALLHGRLDWICRPQSAWDVQQALPGSRLQWIDQAGHSPYEPPMATALVAAIAHAAQHGQFQNWGQPLPSAD